MAPRKVIFALGNTIVLPRAFCYPFARGKTRGMKVKIKPTVDEIKEKYQDYCTVALSTRLKADVTPLKVLKKLKNVSSHCYMLESCDDANETGHYTF